MGATYPAKNINVIQEQESQLLKSNFFKAVLIINKKYVQFDTMQRKNI
jgi:hypothetical protein